MNIIIQVMVFVAAFVMGVIFIPTLAYSGIKFKLPMKKMLGGLCFTLGNMSNGGSALYQEGNKYRIMPLHKPCARCGKRFKPATYFTKLCDDCRKNSKKLIKKK